MKLSTRTKQILLLLSKEEGERSMSYIARKIPGMLYPNLHVIIDRMEFRDGLVKTLKKYSNGTRLIVITSKGRREADKL